MGLMLRSMGLMLLIVCFSTAGMTAPAAGDDAVAEPQRISLWPEKVESKSAITVHLPAKRNGTAVVICPGGGYGGLVTGAEGHGIASWLNGQGIVGVVLEYELPKGRPMVPLRDAQRAIRITRAHAKKWNIDPNRIGIMGFSAGGHLASSAGTHFDPGDPKATDPIKRMSCRPDFMVLVYPVITMGKNTHGGSKHNLLGQDPSAENVKLFSNELQVTNETPPAYLTHAKDDRAVVPENSQQFYEALQAHKIASEYLELPSGGHGLNGYRGPMWDAWQTGALKWLESIEMIPAATEKPE